MPRWTITAESNALYYAWRDVTAEYDAMVDKLIDHLPVERAESDDIINRMEAAHDAWLASMPRTDP